MIKELTQFFHTHFQRSENGLVKVILFNVLSFVALLLLKIILVISGYEAAYVILLGYIALPASWSAYLHQPWALFTHYWVHGSFFSTLCGLLLLYTLGKIVVHRLGSRHFVALYLLGGLAGGLFFLLLYNLSPHFQDTAANLSGFSGSLYAIMVASAMSSPNHSLALFFWKPLTLKYVVGFFILIAVVNLVGVDPVTSVAHLGGALLGYVYVKQFKVYAWLRRQFRTRLSQSRKHLKMTYKRVAPLSKEERNTQQVDQVILDRILDKVATSGYESLNPTEKQQLFNAGK